MYTRGFIPMWMILKFLFCRIEGAFGQNPFLKARGVKPVQSLNTRMKELVSE